MDRVSPLLHWRRGRDSHVREVVKSEIPPEVRDALSACAAEILSLKSALASQGSEVERLRTLLVSLAHEAQSEGGR